MDGENDPSHPEEFLYGIIHGEHVYVHQEGADREDPGEGAGREGAREDEREDDVSSFLNPSGDGMDIETFDDEGQTNTDAERQLQTNADGEVYRFIFWWYEGNMHICINNYFFFSPPDRANHILNEVQAKS
jgi:hypothetical protein